MKIKLETKPIPPRARDIKSQNVIKTLEQESDGLHRDIERLRTENAALRRDAERYRWPRGTYVRKTKGAKWEGRIVGFYSTDLTPEGYAVESAFHPGSVQIYPVGALEEVK